MTKILLETKIRFKKISMMMIDVWIIVISGFMGLLLRFDLDFSKVDMKYIDGLWSYFPYYIVGTIIIFYLFKLYHNILLYASVNEVVTVFSATITASLLQVVGMNILQIRLPRSYYFLSGGVLFSLTFLSRFAYRFIILIYKNLSKNKDVRNIMIIGAGDAANILIKEIKTSDHIHNLKVKCVIDDSIDKRGKYIQGLRIVGDRDNIIESAILYDIDEIVIAMPSISKIEIAKIVKICKDTDCEVKILPGVYQFMTGEVSLRKLRRVDVEDLLGREPIDVDLESIMDYVTNKVVLITGGGGSIGSELCRQIAANNPKQLIIVDIYENNAYDIQQELIKKYPELNLSVLIASVRNQNRINNIFRQYKPNIVYHAAAHKHVPLMEDSPNEAIKNNVLGTWKTVMAADRFGVEKFVLISTDKAVNPTNIMGASKRICEMIVQAYNNRSKTEYVAVRFGNVLGSNGSVIPLFKEQIKQGGPITVTHPDIIRFFMTIPEAVSLVLQAGAYAKGGEIFILDMGEPVKILDLAKNLIRLSGYKENDIKIEFTGLRPGEKLYEEILLEEEGLQETNNKLIHIGKPLEIDEDNLIEELKKLRKICREEPDNIKDKIKELVPTYTNGQII